MILSTPKTGNTWLRWLLHYAYGTPIVELPNEWDDQFAATLPASFVTHQHLPPSESLVRWLVQNRVAVLTTIRHPGDTFISLFHFVKWSDDGADPALTSLKDDGDSPGRNAQRYLQYSFPQAYALSLSWARLGAFTVRYEDLLANPVEELRRITQTIAPIHDDRIRAAAFLCKPEQLTRPGLVDPRHLRVATARRWTVELGGEHLELLRRQQPYRGACERYGYDWHRDAAASATFNYDTIDPFHGLNCFDNGEPIGPTLAKIYYHDVGNAFRRWPEPATTAGESFWKWLIEPLEAARGIERFPQATLTNLMWSIYRMRTDLRVAYPDPLHGDRIRFANWFIGQANTEFALAWGLVSPIADAYCDFLQIDTPTEAPTAGLITDIAICDASGIKARAFACGDQLSIAIEFELFERVERPILEYSLRNHAGVTTFGTNTTLLGSPLPALDAGVHRCRIDTRLTVPPQQAYLSIGLACNQADGRLLAIHRMANHARLDISGPATAGSAWCATTIMRAPAPAAARQ